MAKLPSPVAANPKIGIKMYRLRLENMNIRLDCTNEWLSSELQIKHGNGHLVVVNQSDIHIYSIKYSGNYEQHFKMMKYSST